MSDTPRPTRRDVVRGAAALGISAPWLAACGPTANSSGSSGGEQPDTGGQSPTPLTQASQVPVGGGVVLANMGYVVTQPKPGQFEGFDAICTHQGCPVSSVEGRTIYCSCHGSRFSIVDGSVVQGPASEPLPSKPVRVKGGAVLPASSNG